MFCSQLWNTLCSSTEQQEAHLFCISVTVFCQNQFEKTPHNLLANQQTACRAQNVKLLGYPPLELRMFVVSASLVMESNRP